MACDQSWASAAGPVVFLEFQLAELSSITPRFCQFAEGHRLIVCRIPTPSVFRASSLNTMRLGVNPQAAEVTPGGCGKRIPQPT